MTISYPLQTPTTIGIEEIVLRAANVVAVSESPFTFRQQVFRHPGERWSAAIRIPPLRRDLLEPWVAFLLSLKGPTGTFLLGDPNNCIPQGVLGTAAVSAWFLMGGTWQDLGQWVDSIDWDDPGTSALFLVPQVDGVQPSQTADIAVKGFQASVENWLLPGDYIQLGAAGTATLHKVLLPVSSGPTGRATITVWPAVRRELLDGETLVYLHPRGRFRLSSPAQEWTINNRNAYVLSFEAVEAIP